MKEVTYRVPRARIFSVPVPIETRTYKPVSHREVADITLNCIKRAGFTIRNQEYSSAREGMVANARYTIESIRDEEMGLEIGWQNSYDKSLTLKFAIGTRIFICDNGQVSGNFGSFKKKHTGGITDYAPAQIQLVIDNAGTYFAKMQEEREQMKELFLTKRMQSELVGRLFIEEQLISPTQINIIKRELESPTHDYKSDNSLWELYQYATFSLKQLHPTLWMENHIKIHEFFSKKAVLELLECERVSERKLIDDFVIDKDLDYKVE